MDDIKDDLIQTEANAGVTDWSPELAEVYVEMMLEGAQTEKPNQE